MHRTPHLVRTCARTPGVDRSRASQILVRDLDPTGHRLRFYESGDRADPTILWLHGCGQGDSAMSNWSALISSMPGWHHIAPDLPGMADPDLGVKALGIGATVELRAAAVLSLLDELGLDRVHVVGNSLGALIALRLLLDAPERFGRAVLMGSGVVGTQAQDGRASYRVACHTGALPVSHLFDQLAAIRHEVLVLHGRDHSTLTVEQACQLAARIPNAQLHVLPNAGHWAQIEQVDRFRSLAELFLAEGSA